MTCVSGFDPSKHSLLVVDDEPDTRTLAKKILEHEGFKVYLAVDGEDALSVIDENKDINLVLLDVRLPKINGFEVCKKIKEGKEHPPVVVFFTVLSLNADREKGLEVGGDGFLIKPFSAEALIDYIREKLA